MKIVAALIEANADAGHTANEEELAAIHERGASSSLRPDDKPRHERLREIQLARRTQAESRRDALLAGALALETQEGPAA